nr:hypothetical protein [Tanacetum cinerariifolium]
MESNNRFSSISKEDQTKKISKSVFVTNFPEHFSARDLWNVCAAYVNVIDVYIPLKKSKTGKKIAFARFIRVDNLDRLIDNLCTVWIRRFHLHANVVRFQRESKFNASQPNVSQPRHNASMGAVNNSFANVLKSNNFKPNHVIDSTRAIVLDDSCLFERDFSLSLMGKIKDINAMSNLYFILANEGFENVKLSYLGGMWVLMEMDSIESKEKIIKHVGVGSWFYELKSACNSFVTDERIVWIYVEGLPIKAFTRNAFAKIVSAWGEFIDVEDTDNSSLSFKTVCLKTKPHVFINEKVKVIVKWHIHWIRLKELQSWCPEFKPVNEDINSSNEDFESNFKDNNSGKFNLGKDDDSAHPFEIYKILNRNKDSEVTRGDEPKFPPGFTPDDVVEDANPNDVVEDNVKEIGSEQNSKSKNSMVNNKEGFSSDHIGSSIALKFKMGGSILEVIDELITVRQTMGYNMEVCMKNIESIIGTWVPSSTKLLIISIYAPQELSVKKMLWDYFHHLINSWDGECVILGDFNEVRFEHERHGIVFNLNGANVFNNFITMAGLVDLPLEGYSFTWSRKFASKMSKLDRFLITDGFDKLVEITWKNAACMETNAIVKLKKKLQALKTSIKQWCNEEVISERSKLLKDLFDLNSSTTLDLAQKAKIYWAIEGDENSKYFHGIINKKRSLLAIRGVLIDGEIDDPFCVKNEFLKHFSNLFAAPLTHKLFFQAQFLNRVTSEQIDVLESIASYDEIKRAVWECGTNKSPGPDGFSFEFFQKYLDIIYQDVVAAVLLFFSTGAIDSAHKSSKSSLWLVIIREFQNLSNTSANLLSLLKKSGVAVKMRDSSIISSFRRPPRGGVEEDQLRLLEDIISSVVLSHSSDRWIWRLDSLGYFSVKSARNYIDDSFLPKYEAPTRWIVSIPIRVNIFAWKFCLDKLPTRLNLSLRGLDIPSILCPLYFVARESFAHLLFSYDLARQLSSKVSSWWEVELQYFHSYGDWLSWIKNLCFSKGLKDIFECVLYVTCVGKRPGRFGHDRNDGKKTL